MQSIFRIQLGTRVPRFKPIQIKTAREKLRKGRGLLEKHQCHVVQVPDSGLLVILLGVNHFEIESVKAVERIIQGVCPDAVCVELCEPRVRSAGLREEGRRIRGSSKASLRKDLADELRKQSSDGVRASESGAEMKMAFLEAYRLLKPIHLVDRDILDSATFPRRTSCRSVAAAPSPFAAARGGAFSEAPWVDSQNGWSWPSGAGKLHASHVSPRPDTASLGHAT